MSEEIKITEIPDSTIEEIEKKSAKNLPDRPSAQGMTADAIRAALYLPITDDDNSVIAELQRVIKEANDLFKAIDEGKTAIKKADGTVVTDIMFNATDAGKILTVGEDGSFAPIEVTIGGSY